ncbi:hypothetical protein [Algivirga pacifica]|uniref:Antitoxin component YwqK of the YwqJK toxin-antitoxin module n=1 Tax=Algivirga pacifica TaxID=1162670 RepID=A0ABP9D953_9BACT
MVVTVFKMMMRFSLFFTVILLQQIVIAQAQEVQLLKWESMPCDTFLDPYRLKNRISQQEFYGDTLWVTVNFTDNCCAEFDPVVYWKESSLYLQPYESFIGEPCECRCCFSIRFAIGGLKGHDYPIFFQQKEIVYSEYYYDTIPPKYKVYEGRVINRVNKYGYIEGYWMTFREDGSLEMEEQFTETNLSDDFLEPEWRKVYFPSGQLAEYERGDTTQQWFEDGILRYEYIRFRGQDSTFKRILLLDDNRLLREKSLKVSYKEVYVNPFEPNGSRSDWVSEYLEREEYYENGQLRYWLNADTSYHWNEQGILKRKSYPSGAVRYDQEGKLLSVEKEITWITSEEKAKYGPVNHQLKRIYDKHDEMREVEYTRDEYNLIKELDWVMEEGFQPVYKYQWERVKYHWKWDDQGALIEAPEDWEEPLPWIGKSD